MLVALLALIMPFSVAAGSGPAGIGYAEWLTAYDIGNDEAPGGALWAAREAATERAAAEARGREEAERTNAIPSAISSPQTFADSSNPVLVDEIHAEQLGLAPNGRNFPLASAPSEAGEEVREGEEQRRRRGSSLCGSLTRSISSCLRRSRLGRSARVAAEPPVPRSTGELQPRQVVREATRQAVGQGNAAWGESNLDSSSHFFILTV